MHFGHFLNERVLLAWHRGSAAYLEMDSSAILMRWKKGKWGCPGVKTCTWARNAHKHTRMTNRRMTNRRALGHGEGSRSRVGWSRVEVAAVATRLTSERPLSAILCLRVRMRTLTHAQFDPSTSPVLQAAAKY